MIYRINGSIYVEDISMVMDVNTAKTVTFSSVISILVL